MPADSQALDDSQKVTRKQGRASFFRDDEQSVEDFNEFFEKLSSIDDLTWDSDSSAGVRSKPGRKKPLDAEVVSRAASKAAASASVSRIIRRNSAAAGLGGALSAGSGVRPKIDVFDSQTEFRKEALSTGISQPDLLSSYELDADADQKARILKDRAGMANIVWILKMGVAGLVLFGLGLGAGWAALTLPARFEKTLPHTAKTLQSGQVFNDSVSAVKTWLRGVKAKWGNQTPGNAPRTDGAKDVTFVPLNRDPVMETVEAKPDLPPPGVAKPASSAGKKNGMLAPVISREALLGASAKRPLSAPPAVGGFSLQVGACGSNNCVERYRSLLKGRVAQDAIKVVTQRTAGGTSEIHRIRVSPLTRQEASRLKRELISANSIFGGTYLISLK